jgi:hypothetical protein
MNLLKDLLAVILSIFILVVLAFRLKSKKIMDIRSHCVGERFKQAEIMILITGTAAFTVSRINPHFFLVLALYKYGFEERA